MKTFSRLSLFTIICLGFAVMLVGGTAEVHAQEASLEVTGDTGIGRVYQLNQIVKSKFTASDANGDPVGGAKLTITHSGLTGVIISNGGVTAPPGLGHGTVTVTGTIVDLKKAYIQAVWGVEQLTAKAEFNPGEDPAPLVIVVNPPDPKAPLSVGDTFTQMITIENRDATRTSLPLSAWQMDVVYNPSILKVVHVTEGDLLMKADPDAAENTVSTYYTENTNSPGRIRVSQSRPVHIDNDPMSPDAKNGMDDEATPGTVAGIELAPGDMGTLLTIQFEVLAVAEEPLGIHNVRLQSDTDHDKLPKSPVDLDRDGVADDQVPDRISYSILVKDIFVATHQSPQPVDVNQDLNVDILDLVEVAGSIGMDPDNPRADVNGDGFVNVLDLITIYTSDHWAREEPLDPEDVAKVNEAALAAPSVKRNVGPDTVQSWIDLARIEDDGSAIFDLGIANLEALLASRIPTETRLLLNYPNPFNPETWIPYQLAEATKVTVTIHAMNGSLIRTLELGHQAAGTYKSKSQAAYWDGRNEFGEQVASGLYFYTLTAGDFSATHKMLVRK